MDGPQKEPGRRPLEIALLVVILVLAGGLGAAFVAAMNYKANNL